jgi:hypothetical protein
VWYQQQIAVVLGDPGSVEAAGALQGGLFEGLELPDEPVEAAAALVGPTASDAAAVEKSSSGSSGESSDSSGGSSSAGAEVQEEALDAAPAPAADEHLRDVVRSELVVKYDRFVDLAGRGRDYERHYVACPLHRRCRKHRSTNQISRLGRWEPHAYLLAWAEAAPLFEDATGHVRHRPSQADVECAFRRHFGP